jgi:hypothetical protein
MNAFADLTVKQLRRAIVIKERLTKLESELASLLNVASQARRGSYSRRGRPRGPVAAPRIDRPDGRRRKRSAAWRAKLAAAAKARWKKAKAAGKTSL